MFYFGVDYYPEQWPEERWAVDARLMADAGFNVVRLAEFAWSRLEPSEGAYDFSWLDKVIAILQNFDIQVVLGTPTASAPPWVMRKSPNLFRVREDGLRVTYGNRRAYCPNQPLYHEYSRKIVTRMAEHYASHPAVIGWQIDNEFGERCYCPDCAGKFQVWLRSRYQDLADLNQKWGTVFWSHVYNDWAEIPLPMTTGDSPNPGLALNFYRFCSDSYVAYQQIQIDILRRHCRGQFITHNMMGFGYDRINYFDLAGSLDFVAWDNYPRSQWSFEGGVDPVLSALDLDATRGFKNRNFWIMEQQSGPGGWEIVSVPPKPGELRLWAYQSIAHGADAIVFFRWRTALFGTEQYWHGLLDHNGHLSRRYGEIKRMGEEMQIVGDRIAGTSVKASVAMVLSYDSRFAYQIQPNNPYFSYPEHFQALYRALYNRSIPVDVVDPHADLSAYGLVIAPSLHLLDEECAENLKGHVRAGGLLVVTQRSGVKDEMNNIVNQRLPGLLGEVCGVEVDEYVSLSSEMQNRLEFVIPELSGFPHPAVGVLCDILKPTSASVVARYTQDYYAGKPAITINAYGRGHAVYVGAIGDGQLYDALTGWLLIKRNLAATFVAPEGVEVTERWQGDQRLIFILNHTDRSQTIELAGEYTDILKGRNFNGRMDIEAKGVCILIKGKSM